MSEIQYYGTGRRKRATARVYLRPGTGEIQVNRRTLDSFFPNDVLKMLIRQPLVHYGEIGVDQVIQRQVLADQDLEKLAQLLARRFCEAVSDHADWQVNLVEAFDVRPLVDEIG